MNNLLKFITIIMVSLNAALAANIEDFVGDYQLVSGSKKCDQGITFRYIDGEYAFYSISGIGDCLREARFEYEAINGESFYINGGISHAGRANVKLEDNILRYKEFGSATFNGIPYLPYWFDLKFILADDKLTIKQKAIGYKMKFLKCIYQVK